MGHMFGPSWTNHWVKAIITIPEGLRNVDQPLICTSSYDSRLEATADCQSNLTLLVKLSSSQKTEHLNMVSAHPL
jgi:hypothetical protein